MKFLAARLKADRMTAKFEPWMGVVVLSFLQENPNIHPVRDWELVRQHLGMDDDLYAEGVLWLIEHHLIEALPRSRYQQ